MFHFICNYFSRIASKNRLICLFIILGFLFPIRGLCDEESVSVRVLSQADIANIIKAIERLDDNTPLPQEMNFINGNEELDVKLWAYDDIALASNSRVILVVSVSSNAVSGDKAEIETETQEQTDTLLINASKADVSDFYTANLSEIGQTVDEVEMSVHKYLHDTEMQVQTTIISRTEPKNILALNRNKEVQLHAVSDLSLLYKAKLYNTYLSAVGEAVFEVSSIEFRPIEDQAYHNIELNRQVILSGEIVAQEKQVYSFKNGSYIALDDNNSKMDATLGLTRNTTDLTVKVIDSAGNPVPEARVFGVRMISTGSEGKIERNVFDSLTTNEGLAKIGSQIAATLSVVAEGFYRKDDIEWLSENQTESVLKVTLEREPDPVRMLRSVRRISHNWTESHSTLELGLVLVEERDKRKVNPLFEKSKADIWIEIKAVKEPLREGNAYDMRAYNQSTWEISIIGQNGWTVYQPQPWSYNEDKYDIAPSEGYKDRVTFNSIKSPAIVFLYNQNESRYGKLERVSFLDVSDSDQVKLQFIAAYAVQAEHSDSRSLLELR